MYKLILNARPNLPYKTIEKTFKTERELQVYLNRRQWAQVWNYGHKIEKVQK
jgi:hypothetical protein